ncbi:MAG: DUF1573 domain-containing protein [Bacteroidales bacterium]|jgi:hypothetical protein|nr:DUF1573 domain-containing protein [Bacteroidales bacterium]
MKHILVFFFFMGLAASSPAQPIITFDKTTHDFGKVNEMDGEAIHDFTFRNDGTSPLIIKNVTTTCGCTTPEWTKQPVAPGKSGLIKVSYDVKGRPGAIDKTITVLSNGKPEAAYLRITGEVVGADRAPAEAYRFPMGSLRLSEKHIAFDRVWPYEKPVLTVTAYNPGPDAVKISFVDLPPHIKVEVAPSVIEKDGRASIRITFDAARKNDWGFVSDRFSMVLNDDGSKTYPLLVTATVREDFSRWTAEQLRNAPVAAMESTVVDAGRIKQGEKKEYRIKVTNKGKSKLLLRKVESPSRMVTVSAPEGIAPGASAELILKYDTEGQKGMQNKAVSIITNDPVNEQITLRLKADIE